jgi:hypothetical protein
MFGSKREGRAPSHSRVQAALSKAVVEPPVEPLRAAAAAQPKDTALSDPQPTDRLGLVDRATLDSLLTRWAGQVGALLLVAPTRRCRLAPRRRAWRAPIQQPPPSPAAAVQYGRPPHEHARALQLGASELLRSSSRAFLNTSAPVSCLLTHGLRRRAGREQADGRTDGRVMSAAQAVVQDMFKEAAARRTYWRQRDATRADEEWNEWRRDHDDITQVRWFPLSPQTPLCVSTAQSGAAGSTERAQLALARAADQACWVTGWLPGSFSLHARHKLSPTDRRRAAQAAKQKQEMLNAKRLSQIQELEAQRSSLQVREAFIVARDTDYQVGLFKDEDASVRRGLHRSGKQCSQHSAQSCPRGGWAFVALTWRRQRTGASGAHTSAGGAAAFGSHTAGRRGAHLTGVRERMDGYATRCPRRKTCVARHERGCGGDDATGEETQHTLLHEGRVR